MKNISTDTKRGRGRPARLDRAEGAAIAERLFHGNGYDQMGVAALCDALGVRQPALYRVFGSKAGLLEAALERYADSPFAAFVAEEAALSKTSIDLMRNVLRRAAEVYAEDSERSGCLALETAYGSADPTARQAANVLVDNARSFLTERFEALGAQDADASANAVLLAMRGLSSEARAGRSKAAMQRAVDALVDH